jgi:hypothetical protein
VAMEEMAKKVEVAWVVVESRPVKFWSVEEPVARKFAAVRRLEKVGVPLKVPESAPPLVALKAPPMVVEPVVKRFV